MWLVKKAAQKVYTISQNALKEQSSAEKLFDDLISNSHEVMPIRKMGDLAAASYNIQQFEKIVDAITDKLKQIKYQRKSLKKRLNVLVLVAFLIKHGAGGFIDQFRNMLSHFSKYQNMVNFLAEKDEEMSTIMQQIRERAKYIRTLLMDKAILLREKQVGRLIKEKLFVQTSNGDYSSFKKQQQQKKEGESKIDEFLQHYVWRYTQKIDQKLDYITDILIAKIDQYLDGQIPQDFQIDEAEMVNIKPSATKSQFELGGDNIKKQQIKFIESKLLIHQPVTKDSNLLQLDNAIKRKDLIVFQEQICEMKENSHIQANKIGSVQKLQTKLLDDQQIETFRNELSKQSIKI